MPFASSPDDPVTSALLALLRRGPGPEAADLEALREDDWTRLVHRAKVHRVAPLIYRRVVTDGLTPAVPASAIEFLRDESLRNSLHNMKIFKALGEILEALNHKGISVMLLKGVHLAEFYYPDRTLRPMVDIDIMVKSADYDKAAAALLKSGYNFRFPDEPKNLDIRYPRHIGLSSRRGVAVELHHTFEPPDHPKQIDMSSVWSRAQPLRRGRNGILGLRPSDLALHLCMHLANQDSFTTGLIALHDVSLVCSPPRGEFLWDDLITRATEWDASRAAYLVLRLAKELRMSEPPDDALKALRPCEMSARVLSEARELMLHVPEKPIREPTALLQIAGSLSFARKAEILIRRVFLPRRLLAQLYGIDCTTPRIYLYYFRRLVDLLRRHRKTIWGLARHNELLTEERIWVTRKSIMWEWLRTNRAESSLTPGPIRRSEGTQPNAAQFRALGCF